MFIYVLNQQPKSQLPRQQKYMQTNEPNQNTSEVQDKTHAEDFSKTLFSIKVHTKSRNKIIHYCEYNEHIKTGDDFYLQ